MATPPNDKLVPYCACTFRRTNAESTSTNTTCVWCHRLLPDDKTIYMVLKDHIQYLQYLGDKVKAKSKKTKKKISRADAMNAIESLPDREDIQELLGRYGSEVLCASVRVLVNRDRLREGSLLFSSLECPPPAAGPEEVADKEAVWDVEPEPAKEEAPACEYLCEPEVAAEDHQGTKDAEPEAIEEEYVGVRAMEEKPCDDDYYGKILASNEPADDTTKTRDPEESQETQHGPQLHDEADECAPYWNRYDDKDEAVNLQLSSQYELMVQLQRYIERACYVYGRREIPTTLSRHSWDCNEAVTLDRWMREFLVQLDIFETRVSAESLQSLFQRLCEVQRANIDRTRLTLDEIHEFLSDARTLMVVLNVKEYEELIKKLEVDIGKLLTDFDIRNRSFRQRRDGKIKQIQSERARLDRLEKEIIAEVKEDIEGNQRMVKSEIRIVLDKTAAKFETDIEWEKNREE
ncbi:hypothetical protein IL306_011503 [Fusarium sp. DS 682]|nr:hypothetical protein IL306_011503 [Fusarium sp. DS 682]